MSRRLAGRIPGPVTLESGRETDIAVDVVLDANFLRWRSLANGRARILGLTASPTFGVDGLAMRTTDGPTVIRSTEATGAAVTMTGMQAATWSSFAALLDAPTEYSSGMVAAFVQIPGFTPPAGGEDPANLHVTLSYLGEAVNLDDDQKALIHTALDMMASELSPFDMVIAGILTGFGPNHDAVVAIVESEPLCRVRDMVSIFDAPDSHPAWIPHVTLGYGIALTPEILALAENSTLIHVDALSVSLAGVREDFPLSSQMAMPAPAEAPPVAAPPVEGEVPPPTPPEPPTGASIVDNVPMAGNVNGLVLPNLPHGSASVSSKMSITIDGVTYPVQFDTGTAPALTGTPDSLVPWTAVLAIEGEPTRDGRFILPGALEWAELPQSLMSMLQNPDGGEGHAAAALVGRIDEIWRVADPVTPERNLIMGKGVLDSSIAAGAQTIDAMDKRLIRGVSIDLAVFGIGIVVGPNGEQAEAIAAGQIMGATVCPFAAFEEATIELGDQALVAAGGQHAIRATAYFAIRNWGNDDQEALVASGCHFDNDLLLHPPAAWFAKPALDRFTTPQVTAEGRLFGHVSRWGVAHIGFNGREVYAPRNRSGYKYFVKDNGVITAEGRGVATGVVFLGGDHAPVRRGFSREQALDHYAATSSAVADVSVYEDDFGIVVAGAIRPTATPEQIRALRASRISPDWRPIAGSMSDQGMEMVAALTVNCTGFPSESNGLALVASGRAEADFDPVTGEILGGMVGIGVLELRTDDASVAELNARVAAMEQLLAPQFAAIRQERAAAAFARLSPATFAPAPPPPAADAPAAKPHDWVDANGDGKCDVCGLDQAGHDAQAMPPATKGK